MSEVKPQPLVTFDNDPSNNKEVEEMLDEQIKQNQEKYKEATKGLEETSREAKYRYLDTKLMKGWNTKGKLKERIEKESKKIPFFLRKKKEEK